MANAAGPNPVLLVRDHLAEHIAELEKKLAKHVNQVVETQRELAIARTLQMVVPEPAKEKDPEA